MTVRQIFSAKPASRDRTFPKHFGGAPFLPRQLHDLAWGYWWVPRLYLKNILIYSTTGGFGCQRFQNLPPYFCRDCQKNSKIKRKTGISINSSYPFPVFHSRTTVSARWYFHYPAGKPRSCKLRKKQVICTVNSMEQKSSYSLKCMRKQIKSSHTVSFGKSGISPLSFLSNQHIV